MNSIPIMGKGILAMKREIAALVGLFVLLPSLALGASVFSKDIGASIVADQQGSSYIPKVSTAPATAAASQTTLTSVNDSATSQQLLAASSTRVGFSLFNDSTETAYIGLGVTPTSTSFNVKLVPGAYFEQMSGVVFTGVINAIWSADASGAMRVTRYESQ